MGARKASAFGTLLRKYRQATGLSQEELAERAGLSLRGVSDLERGVRMAPRLETVRLLAEGLALEESDRAALFAARDVVSVDTQEQSSSPALPIAVTPLIGRACEVETVVGLLQREDVRLVTLTGPGGVGKTRLAFGVAQNLANRFREEILFVDLSPVRNVALVLPTVAVAAGVQDTGVRALEEVLAFALNRPNLLLVLDNLEQVVDAATDIASLLAACPSLTILATSRVRLRLAAEHVFPVLPLRLPETGARPSLADLAQTEAVAFFVDRAQAADPFFALTESNRHAITTLVDRLEGLPLAIELAAARTGTLPPEALLSRLEHTLLLLRGGARDAPVRQRTMRDAIAWSYDLLMPEEQRLFRHLAVFVGGFTVESAATVAGSEGDTSETGVLDGIASLVDTSLLRPDMGLEVEPRYRMLETVREFGLEQVVASEEEASVRDAHAGYFLQLAEQSNASFLGPDHRRWLDRLDAEQGNLRSAAAWFENAEQFTHLLRLLRALGHFWYSRGSLTEGRTWMSRVLSLDTGESNELKADGLAWAGALAHRQYDTNEALSLAQASLAEWDASGGNGPGRYRAVLLCAIALDHFGEPDRAAVLYAEAADGFRANNEAGWAGIAVVNLAFNEHRRGRVERAHDLGKQGLALLETARSPWGLSFALATLGDLAFDRGDYPEAADRYRESLLAAIDAGDSIWIGDDLVHLGVVAAATNDTSRGVQLFAAAEKLREDGNLPLQPYIRPGYESSMLKARESLDKHTFEELWNAGRGWSMERALSEALAVAPGGAEEHSLLERHQTQRDHHLTERELEVLRLLVMGKTDREIADALFVSRRTITTHTSGLFAKLGVSNRVQAATVTIQAGLL